jgi:hypothetical protein
LLNELASKGVLPIAGAGNDGAKTIAGLPAGLGVNDPVALGLPRSAYVPEMLVVGAVDATGAVWYDSNEYAEYGLPHIYAPGVAVLTAFANPPYDEEGRVLYVRPSGPSLGTYQPLLFHE